MHFSLVAQVLQTSFILYIFIYSHTKYSDCCHKQSFVVSTFIMRTRLCFLLFLFLPSLVGVRSRNLAPNDGFAVNNNYNTQGTAQKQQSLQIARSIKEGMKKSIGEEKIGSSPPRCEHKCYGCSPCEAIQVPTTSSRVGLQYTNYEPEGWKCKCGPTLYTP